MAARSACNSRPSAARHLPARPLLRAAGLLALLVAASVWSWIAALRADEPAAPAAAPQPADDAAVRFETHVAPLLETRCLKCHGDGKLEAGFDVRRRATLLAGGDSGPSLVPGKPDESLLLQRIDKNEMPPADEGPLTDAQKSLLRRWIAAGAPLAGDSEKPLDDVESPSRLSEEDRAFWAFRPPVRPTLPAVRQVERLRSPVDAFVAAAQESQGLGFNPDARPAALLRRLTLDLVGLNPTPDELDDFLADEGPDAYERLVDRLLASPRYGERWGRHWLDTAGYADSDGYLAADRLRPQAWRYRDYVVQSLNADLPYDRFLREQLAGDELADWRSSDEFDPSFERSLVATGFLRTASDPTYPGYTEPNEIHQVLSDTLQIVGSTFLGLTIQCARCHAHKFDPLSQRDYYGLQSVFLPALDPARWQPSEVRGVPLASDSQAARIAQANQEIDARVAAWNKESSEWTERFRRRRVTELLASGGEPFVDAFDGPTLDSRWLTVPAGTGKSWQTRFESGRLEVRSIDGQPGYALIRLVRPVVLEGEFRSRLSFSWSSADGPASTNAAMQGVLLQLRDATGAIVASGGMVDENNTALGSPLVAAAGADAPIGPDLVAANVKKYGQAAPPDMHAKALPASGKATVVVERDAAGRIVVRYEDATGRRLEATAENRTPATSVEIEFRRFVLTPGATFEGLAVDEFAIEPAAAARLDAARIDALATAVLAPEKSRTEAQKQLVARLAPSVPVAESDLAAAYPEYAEKLEQLKASIAAETAKKREVVRVRGLMDLDGAPPEGKILRRGDPTKPGGSVAPSVPEVLTNDSPLLDFQPVGKSTGRRKALADWLARPDNRLTARVQVNRIWAKHFGKGVVPTVANFGRSGARPTHPELLDWLALELPRRDWSVKELHRLLVTSTVFRQNASWSAEQRAADPENSLWSAWTPRRQEGEVVRDVWLQLADKLNLVQGGPPAPVAAQGDGSVLHADDAQGNRRSIYLIVRRSQHLTLLDLFDTPVMEVNCPERNTSTVPLQALALLHGPFARQAAVDFGRRIQASAADDDGRIAAAFRLVYNRPPSATETARAREFLDAAARDATPSGGQPTEAARAPAFQELALILLNSNESLYAP